MDKWISVKDRLPKVNTVIIVFEKGRIVLDYYGFDFGSSKPHFCFYGAGVTHWIPLPEPPKQ